MKKNSLFKASFLLFALLLAGCQNTNGQQLNISDPANVPNASQEMQGDQGSQNTNATLSAADQAYQKQLLAGPVKKCIDAKEEGEGVSCYEDFLQQDVKQGGPELAFKDLKVLYNTAPIVQTYCHPMAHVIGRAAVEKYPVVAEAYQHGDSYCWSGYYHGVMEQISKNIGPENLPAKMDTICDGIPGKQTYSFDYYNCVHGLGHGVMEITNDQLFDSLKLCDHLTGAWEQQSCYGGVYMENVIIDNLNHHTDYLKPSEPMYPCTAVDQKYKQACYLMQTSYALKVTNYDFKKVFDLCANADKGFEVTCYQSLGRDASGSTISNIDKTKARCFLGQDYTQKSECIVGAVKDFISYYHSDIQGKDLCNALGDAKMTQYCLDTATTYYKTF